MRSLQITENLAQKGWYYLTATSDSKSVHIFDFGLEENAFKKLGHYLGATKFLPMNHRSFAVQNVKFSGSKLAMMCGDQLILCADLNQPYLMSVQMNERSEFGQPSVTKLI